MDSGLTEEYCNANPDDPDCQAGDYCEGFKTCDAGSGGGDSGGDSGGVCSSDTLGALAGAVEECVDPGPPSPPPAPSIYCDIQLQSQDVGSLPIQHTRLLLSVDDNGVTQDGYLEAQPIPMNPNGNWLLQVLTGQAWLNESFTETGLYSGPVNFDWDFANTYSNQTLCNDITTLGEASTSYPDNTIVYNAFGGPNSNTFTWVMTQGAGLYLPPPLNTVLFLTAPGWPQPL